MNKPFFGREPAGGPAGHDIRPLVAIPRQHLSGRWFAGTAVIAAVLLFSALEARRRGSEQSAAQSAAPSALVAPEAMPELVISGMPADHPLAPAAPQGWAVPGDQQRSMAPSAAQQLRPALRQPAAPLQSFSAPGQIYAPPPPLLVSSQAGGGPYVMSITEGLPPGSGGAQGTRAGRITPERLKNPTTTVVQGTLINAVLETALDSTRPGQSRALVTRDVFGFDGTRLLIPRGTRLYGEYQAGVAQGQKRAQIRWARLLRPDGVSVALDSPAADPLGRAGVEGSVNNHFLQRLGNTLLSTTLNLGSALGMRSIASPVVVAMPGAAQAAGQSVMSNTGEIAPTLTVRHGTRVTVFVQHDLDFASVDETR